MRFAVRILVVCLVVGITTDPARAAMSQGVATAFSAGYAGVMIGLILVPCVALLLLAISFSAKKAPPPHPDDSPDLESARDDT
jgi:hypothetical protein